MAKARKLEFANVIIRFGDALEMIDLFEQVVLPAFTDTTLRRDLKATDFFFLNVSLSDLDSSDEESMGVVGRFVRNTTLIAEQQYDASANELVETSESLKSAPSSLFAFRIADHKLLWLHEHVGAPSLQMFEATLRVFLRKKHQLYLRTELARRKSEAKKAKEPLPSLSDLRKEIPPPTVEIVPVGSQASLKQFIEQFSILSAILIEFLVPNAELDNNPVFDGVHDQQKSLDSNRTRLSHANAKGLNKDAAIKVVTPATERANARVTLTGKDANGDKLQGNEDKFRVQVPIENVPKEPPAAGRVLNGSFRSLVKSGTIALGTINERCRKEASKVIRRLRGSDGDV